MMLGQPIQGDPSAPEPKRQKVLFVAGAMGVIVFIAWISGVVANFTLQDKIIGLLKEDVPELEGMRAATFDSMMQMLYRLVMVLLLPALGIYGAMKMERSVIGIFWGCSACCSCCSCCYVFILLLALVSFGAVHSEVVRIYDICDVAAACPLQGTRKEVVDCLAASTWHSRYSRVTNYGTPMTEECPPIFLNCSTAPANSNTSPQSPLGPTPFPRLFSVEDKLLGLSGLLPGANHSTPQGTGPRAHLHALYRHAVSHLLPQVALPQVRSAAKGGDVLRLSTRRLAVSAAPMDSKTRAILSDTVVAENKASEPAMPADPIASCSPSTTAIHAFYKVKEALVVLSGPFRGFLALFVFVYILQLVAYAAGAFFGKDLFDNMPGAPSPQGYGGAGPHYAGVVQGYPLQGNVVMPMP